MKIDGITYSSGIVSVHKHLSISSSEEIGYVDNAVVYETQLGNGTCYFLYDTDQTLILSYVVTDRQVTNGYYHLRQIENTSGIPGAVSALLYFLTNKQGYKFVITKTEPVTLHGLRWIISVLRSPRNLFNLVDPEGNLPDATKLYRECERSRIDLSFDGETSIFIESYSASAPLGIFESSTGLLRNHHRILFDHDLE